MKKAADPAPLEAALGHCFRRRVLLEQALTHSSYANEQDPLAEPGQRPADNEQLEFLGDAILGFITSRALYERYPQYSEGHLSKIRAHLVSSRHLIKVAKQLQLGEYLWLGRGEERSGGRQKAALLVDALEALLAALYLDSGLETVQHFTLRHIVNPELERIEHDMDKAISLSDQKSALQEWLQATGRPQPAYHVIKEEGPDHRKIFTVELSVMEVGGESLYKGRAMGPTKKKAEQNVAQLALAFLRPQQPDARRA